MNNSSQLSVQDLVKLIQKNPDQSEAILNWYLTQNQQQQQQPIQLAAGDPASAQSLGRMLELGVHPSQDGMLTQPQPPMITPSPTKPSKAKVDAARQYEQDNIARGKAMRKQRAIENATPDMPYEQQVEEFRRNQENLPAWAR